MSIQKVAQIAGVSVATVSRVLNNVGSVKKRNRDKVLSAIKKSNYQPNLLARQLRTSHSGMLLVMVSNISNPFCAEVVRGIETEAEKNNYRILLCNSESDVERFRSNLYLLTGKMVDGIITMDAISKLPELQAIIGQFPWVQCAEFDINGNTSSVGIDDLKATRFAIEVLIKQGRKRIAMINHDKKYLYAQQREIGYMQTLAENQIKYHQVEYASSLNFLSGKHAMLKLMSSKTIPDALFTISDVLAAGAITAIIEKGFSIPDDIAIIGFDGGELSSITIPPLSTIAQPSREIGAQAAKLLLKQIKDPNSPIEKIILDWQFIERQSTTTF